MEYNILKSRQNGGKKMPNRKLKAMRYLSGMSQDELASLVKISQAKISRIELGYIRPSTEDKEKIAEALKISSEELFPEV